MFELLFREVIVTNLSDNLLRRLTRNSRNSKIILVTLLIVSIVSGVLLVGPQTSYAADHTPPQVALIAPVTGETVFGPQVYLYATSTDDVSVAGVRFYLNNTMPIGPEITSKPYVTTWDASAFSGSHSIQAVARDSSNNYATSSASIIVSVNGAVYLTPGSGFSAATPQSPQTGIGTGSDEKAIARWDVVPYQTFSDTMNVGVVAFHMNGIKKVSFSANGGDWTDVTQMTRNPETNVVEYWTTIRASDFVDGQIEIRAIVYPRAGIPRVLQGVIPLMSTSNTEATNGEHSMWLFANSNSSWVSQTVYVNPSTGNDSNDGSLAFPLATLVQALRLVNLNKYDGATIVLMEAGQYNPDYDNGIGVPSYYTPNRWVTVKPASNLLRSDILIVGSGVSSDIINFSTKKIKWENVTIPTSTFNYLNIGSSWFDHAVLTGGSGGFRKNLYFTDCYVQDNNYGFVNAQLVRGGEIYNTLDAFQRSQLVINSHIESMGVVDPTIHHPDVIQTWGQMTNNIYYGLSGKNINNTQGIFINSPLSLGPNMIDAAFINIYLEVDYLPQYTLHSQFNGPLRNILLTNVKIPNQKLLFRDDATDISHQPFSGTNVVFKESTFSNYSPYLIGVPVAQTGAPAVGVVGYAADSTAPSILNISSGIPSETSATITWDTDELADTQIEYGLTSSYTTSSTLDATMATSHSVGLTGLTPNTTYHYRIISNDPFQNEATSNDQIFTTSGGIVDETPPNPGSFEFTNVTTYSITASSTGAIDETGLASLPYVYHNITTGEYSEATSTAFTFTGLTRGTSYTFEVGVRDLAGNWATTTQLATTTLATVPTGPTPPEISGGLPSGTLSAGTTQTTLQVSSNQEAVCKYDIIANTPYESMAHTFSTTGGTTHKAVISGLSSGNSYTYHIRCTDGENTNSSDYSIVFSVAKQGSASSGPGGGSFVVSYSEVPSASVPSPSLSLDDLLALINELQKQINKLSKPQVSPVFVRDLSFGTSGKDVEALQEILIAQNYLAPGKNTGYFGPLTRSALVAYQEENNITPAFGYFGPKTREALLGITSESAFRPQFITKTLVYEMTDPEVTTLQQILQTLPGIYPEGLASGFFGEYTLQAVKKFQLEYGVVTSSSDAGYGIVGPKTRARLNEFGTY